jgi:hypothetical protein
MDSDIAALARAGAAERRDELVQRAEHARKVRKLEKDEREKAATTPTMEAAKLAAITIPGASHVLGIPQPSPMQTPLRALAKLALSPKVRGTGAEVDKCRTLQTLGCALLGITALERQSEGWLLWLNRDREAERSLRGLSCMFDGASQKSRGVLHAAREHKVLSQTMSQKLVEFLVVLASVVQVDMSSNGAETWAWQPWLCPPLLLASTKAVALMAALNIALPINFADVDSLVAFATGVFVAMLVVCSDYAASNRSCLRDLQNIVDGLPARAAAFVMHCERCFTHALHITKAAAMSSMSLASHLFALSKVVGHSRSVDGLVKAMLAHVEGKLEIVDAAPEVHHSRQLKAMILMILGLDGDDSMIYQQGGKFTNWLKDIELVCARSLFDRTRGKWIFVRRAGLTTKAMVSYIADPMLKVLVARRWESAALNRWSGTIRCMKRCVLGCILNGILPESLAGLSENMQLTEAKVTKLLLEHQQRQLAGEQNDEGKWLLHCQRVVRISAFFQLPARRWQLGAVLLGASVVDRLHWEVLGTLGKPKLQLTGLVDPSCSRVAKTLADLLALMLCWSLEHPTWVLLGWLGLVGLEDQEVMMFCRSLLVSLSAGVFTTGEMKFACWPYLLQRIISNSTTRAEKMQILRAFLSARECCLGSFGTRLRKLFPTLQALDTPLFTKVILMFQALLKFTTGPVENEHKKVKDDLASVTSGSAAAPACWRSVCKHLQAAHLQRGGVDISLWSEKRFKNGDGANVRFGPIAEHRDSASN